jgi:nondiscriminating glutamyl-tRNA synthetase
MSPHPRVRFAPSPTGSLHLGNARTALFNWLVARRAGGTFVLRIEDTDVVREQEGAEAGILDDLRWLGLDWDEGLDAGGPFGPYRQSERGRLYREAAELLLERGRAYRCFCTDEELEAEREAARSEGRPLGYSGRCRALDPPESARRAASEPAAIRFRTLPTRPSPADLHVAFQDRLRGRVEFSTAELGDGVLLRRDGRPTYNFAVVVDDAAMEIDLVIRGDDHLSNTPRQVLLFHALGRELPEFAHLPMVRGADGERLSKRHGAVSVAEFRRLGYPREGMLNALALLGWSPRGERTVVGLDDLVAEFELERVSRSPAVFDRAKLDWISAQHLHRMPVEALAEGVEATLVGAGLLPEGVGRLAPDWIRDLAETLRTALEQLGQAPSRCEGLFWSGGAPEEEEAVAILRAPDGNRLLESLEAVLAEGPPPADREAWRNLAGQVRTRTGLKGKALFQPIRAAFTGRLSGPELDRLVPLIAAGNRLFPDRIVSLEERVRSARQALG